MKEMSYNAKTRPLLVIHHISHIQVGQFHYEPDPRYPFHSRKQGSYNIDLYLNYLSKQTKDNLPDLVIISGDLTSYASEYEFDIVEDKIKKIKNLLIQKKAAWRNNNNSPYILMVPGNHDLDWSKETYEEKINRYARKSNALYDNGKVLSAFYLNDSNPVSWDFGDECNLFIYLLNITPRVELKDDTLNNIYNSLCENYKLCQQTISNKEFEEKFLQDLHSFEKMIGRDPGYISIEDLEKMRKVLRNVPMQRFKIAVTHHNLSGILMEGQESFDFITNGVIKEFFMKSDFDIVLHGHSHCIHCGHERFLPSSQGRMKGMAILGGEALGTTEGAPFLQVKLIGTNKNYTNKFPARQFTVSRAKHQLNEYIIKPHPYIEDLIDDVLFDKVRRVFLALDCDISTLNVEDRKHLKKCVETIQRPLQALHYKLVDWGDESDSWIGRFHFHLEYYHRVYATDYYPRSALDNSRFNSYLRQQYNERLNDLKSIPDRCLYFSKPVYDAIIKTGWKPDHYMWGDYKIKEANSISRKELEIARILIRPKFKNHHRLLLENLDYDHKLFAIPLFVIEDKELQKEDMVEFVIGFKSDGFIFKCYKFDEEIGKVIEANPGDGALLAAKFERILSNKSLKTVDEFLGNRIMIRDPDRFKSFADNYDKTRQASAAILKMLRENLNPSPNKIGMDIGCGTGNYTIPFIEDFGKVIGLDINEEMLDKARDKVGDKVEWIKRNALSTGIANEYCDAVWLISTLHYFIGEKQKDLFKEIYRILKPGGVVVANIEFKEQQDSLWLVEFFPSLRDIYKNSCLSKETYEKWLHEIGFIGIKLETLTYKGTKEDITLRSGQHKPEIYLDSEILRGIPAFYEMKHSELGRGLDKLRTAIKNHTIYNIIQKYEQSATLKGDSGFIIATRPRK